MSEERIVWSGRPSHVINTGVYAVCILFSWLLVPACYGLWRWLQLRTTEYELTDQRLKVRSGVLSRSTNTLELYRVRDFSVQQPFALRPFGLGDIVLNTTDLSDPVLVLRAVSDADQLADTIRQRVEHMRIGRAREYEVN